MSKPGCVFHTLQETCLICGHPEYCPDYGSRVKRSDLPNERAALLGEIERASRRILNVRPIDPKTGAMMLDARAIRISVNECTCDESSACSHPNCHGRQG